MDRRRVLLRLAFDGARFHGTQRQPDVATVNQAVLDALDDGDQLAQPHRLRAQGRIDSGASARDHPIAVDVTAPPQTVARTVAGGTTGIVPWAVARVADGFDPRLTARSRTYRYRIPRVRDSEVRRLRRAWSSFEGTHDISQFARIEPSKRDQDPVRRITRCRSWREGAAVVLGITGPTFLRHQVRRMVGAALLVARGELSLDRLRGALAGRPLGTHAKAPPEGLILWRVALSADWEPTPEAERIARERLRGTVETLEQRLTGLDVVMEPRGPAGTVTRRRA